MGAINKYLLLESLEQRVEQHLNDAVSIFQNLDEELLLQPSASGGWSIAQCLWHLNSYGDFYLPEIENALEKEKGDPSKEMFKGSWIGSYFTKMMEPETGKKKIKAIEQHVPQDNLEGHVVVAEFIRQQELLMKYMREARKKDLDAIKLPVTITKLLKLKLGDILQFMVAHDERHMVQAKRNLDK